MYAVKDKKLLIGSKDFVQREVENCFFLTYKHIGPTYCL